MLLLFDDTSNRGSEADLGTAADADRQFYADDEQQHFEGENYQSASAGGSSTNPNRKNLIEKAQQVARLSAGGKGKQAMKKVGGALGDSTMFDDDSRKGREKTKEYAKEKARDYAKEQIGKKITNEGVKKGFEKGLEKGASSLAKEGAKKAAGKVAAKASGQAAAKGLQAAVTAGGAATGFETLGLGFLVSFLLNIAISLGVSDAVDAGFALKDGDVKQALFLVFRAASKVGMFVYLLVTLVFVFSIGGMIIGIPLLLGLNLYMLAGFAFPKIPHFQGLVWWEKFIVIFLDVMAILILLAFLGALGWYLCGEGTISGTVMGAIASVYDWWNKSSTGGVAADFCQFLNTTASTPAGQ